MNYLMILWDWFNLFLDWCWRLLSMSALSYEALCQ